MKPHWMPASQESAELEALQTDVMRFIAILGLCLAAIFSLVHSAALEQQMEQQMAQKIEQQTEQQEATQREATQPTPVLAVKTTVAPAIPEPAETAPQPEAVAEAKAETVTTIEAAKQGFTLEFASAEALGQLLREQQITLYAGVLDEYWRADRQGRFTLATAPASFYRMQLQTVPTQLQRALVAVAGEEPASWGVTLPAGTTRQIGALTRANPGGALVIDHRGGVSLE